MKPIKKRRTKKDHDRRRRIEDLKKKAYAISGPPIVSYEDPNAPLEVLEAFWESVLATELQWASEQRKTRR